MGQLLSSQYRKLKSLFTNHENVFAMLRSRMATFLVSREPSDRHRKSASASNHFEPSLRGRGLNRINPNDDHMPFGPRPSIRP